MGKRQYAARIDDNQKQIVENLRKILGVSVVVGHNDILVGYNGMTFWYEIKNPRAFRLDGQIRKKEIKESQRRLLKFWKGHYKIVSTFKEILNDLFKHGMEPF
jgi:hypothetical protein